VLLEHFTNESHETKTKVTVADLGEGPGGPIPLSPPPLIWVKNKKTHTGRKSQQGKQAHPPPPLSSRSGSVTEQALLLSTKDTGNTMSQTKFKANICS